MHKMLFRRWVTDLWSGRCRAADLVSDDFVGHWPNRDIRGPSELQSLVDDTRDAFKELQCVMDVGPLYDGEFVAGRWIGTGSTKDGPVRYTGNDIVRIANGRIVEYWNGSARG
ncbi:ester cyclase [Mycobacterium sp. SMC-4]|uniref:ester cyclase n=1 Tax=Mycobacterium sp. SMC-4 TaxID=2857059 RepID=UPI0021B3A5D4|nr:ester cyclase [Mycobacterium sp. SMC-4]